jgi:futalosine hydrolase
MNCLIVAATANEIAPFLKELRAKKDLFSNKNIDVLITGIGLTATTYSLLKQLQIKRPDLAIQAGIAGCYDTKIPLASVFIIKQDVIADLGVMENKKLKSLFDLELIPKNSAPYSNSWLVNNKAPKKIKIKIKKVNAVSVNEITSSKEKMKIYSDKYKPVIESMEGAALHYVCLMEKIPFLQLRSTSNYITERNKKNWKLKESISNLNKELINLLQRL